MPPHPLSPVMFDQNARSNSWSSSVASGGAGHLRLVQRRVEPAGTVADPAEELLEQVPVDRVASGGEEVRERRTGGDAVVEARVGVGDHELRDGAAGAAGADGAPDLAVLLDDPLTGHDLRLGDERRVAVVPEVVQGGAHDHEALAEQLLVEHVRGAADGAVHAARAAVRDDELAVPLRLGRPRVPLPGGIVQGGDPVLVAVLVAGLDAHDERDGAPAVGRGGAQVARRARRVVRPEAAVAAVEQLVARRLVALRVAGAGLAGPGLDLRSGEHRAAVGVPDEPDRRAGAVGGAGRRGGRDRRGSR
ncbi:hypothetical protein GKE82_10875 [Conexibacter sp. W3-3-2]|nr:hypothetical protein [Conexibacter sp. W3-3-2]MTD44779.1 hypothetical protein [Conexibacter sp. W3-3-2]